MLFSNKPIQFVFFSDEAANAFSDSSRRLLTWAGEGYSDSCRVLPGNAFHALKLPYTKFRLKMLKSFLLFWGTVA